MQENNPASPKLLPDIIRTALHYLQSNKGTGFEEITTLNNALTALDKIEAIMKLLGPLVEAREKATSGEWMNHGCKAKCAQVWSAYAQDIVALCNTAEDGEGFTMEQANNNADFIALAANVTEQIRDLLKGMEETKPIGIATELHPDGLIMKDYLNAIGDKNETDK